MIGDPLRRLQDRHRLLLLCQRRLEFVDDSIVLLVPALDDNQAESLLEEADSLALAAELDMVEQPYSWRS